MSIMSDEEMEIIESVTNPQVDASDSDDESGPSGTDIPTIREGMEMLEKYLKWYEHQSEATPTSLLTYFF